MEQISGRNGKPTDIHGHIEVDNRRDAVRHDQTRGESLEAGDADGDTGAVADAAIGDHARRAEMLQRSSSHVAGEAGAETVLPDVLHHVDARLRRLGNPLEQLREAVWAVVRWRCGVGADQAVKA